MLSNNKYLFTLSVLLLGIGTGIAITKITPGFSSIFTSEEEAFPFAQNHVPVTRSVSLKVGESQVVHGKRGKCGKLPPSIESIKSKLPKSLKTGNLQTGNLGLRSSRSCKNATPAREIIFVATSPGSETVRLYGDDIDISVIPN